MMVSVVLTALQGAYYRVSLVATFISKKKASTHPTLVHLEPAKKVEKRLENQ